MKRILFILLIATVAFGQYGHKGGSSASSMMVIIADSSKWTDGSTVNAIKPRNSKTVEADSVKAGALEVTGNARFNSNVTMVTTAGEQVQLGTGSDAAPELSSAGDTNTGIRFPGGDKMQLVHGGLNSHTFRPYRYSIYNGADTLSIWTTTSNTYIGASGTLRFFGATGVGFGTSITSLHMLTGTEFYPITTDQSKIGRSGYEFKELWITDNGYFGGKSNTAKLIWGQQAVKTQETDSCGILDMNGGAPRIRMMGASGNEGLSYNAGSVAVWDSLNVHKEKSVVADDGTITLATGVAGFGEVMAGDNEQWAHFRFSSDGTVTLIANSALVSKTAAAGDDSLMVYDAGSGIAIKNRLGGTKKIAVNVNYFSP